MFNTNINAQGVKMANSFRSLPFDVTHDLTEFNCNNCGAGLCLSNWNTEYGDPLCGEYDIECPDCSHEFNVYVEWKVRVSRV